MMRLALLLCALAAHGSMAHKDFFDVLGRISQTSTSHNLRLSRCFTDEQRASVKTCVAVARDVLKLPADARVPPPAIGWCLIDMAEAWDNATETVVVPALRQKVIDVMTSLSADQKQSVAEATQQCVDSGVEFKPNPLFAHKHKPVEWIDAEKDVPEEMKLEAKKRMRGLLCLARSLIASGCATVEAGDGLRAEGENAEQVAGGGCGDRHHGGRGGRHRGRHGGRHGGRRPSTPSDSTTEATPDTNPLAPTTPAAAEVDP